MAASPSMRVLLRTRVGVLAEGASQALWLPLLPRETGEARCCGLSERSAIICQVRCLLRLVTRFGGDATQLCP